MDGDVPGLTTAQRARLRDALASLYPWLQSSSTLGPATVDAGNCDDCGQHPRLATTCGPDGRRLCRDCLLVAGTSAWCDGHHADALEALTAAQALDDDWASLTTLWWYSTGELPADESWHRLVADLPRVQVALEGAGDR